MKSATKYHQTENPLKKPLIFLMIVFCMFGYTTSLSAQNCRCELKQVKNNTVTPCNITVGSVVKVANVTELQNAINQANSKGGNMTILIANGTYQIATTSWYPYITASNIVFRGFSGNRDSVILRGGGMVATASTEDIFSIVGNNVTIADMTLQECGNHGIQVSGANLLVHNVHFKNTYQQMLKGATGGSTIDSATVQCSLFEYPNGIGPNYYIGGLDIHKGTNWLVCDNVFVNIKSPSGSVAEHAIHFWDNSSNNIVERNLVINCDRGIGFGLGSSQNNGGIIRNNMIYNNGSGQFSDVGIGLETSPNTKVYNNTVYVAAQNAIEYRFTATSGVDIKNNITNKPITSRDGAKASLQTNVNNAQASWFVNLTLGDLHLATGIVSVVDMGTNLSGYVSNDIDKTTRPQGIGFDIGADEFNSGAYITDGSALPNNLVIFPNPASNGKFNIELKRENLKHEIKILIYDLLGEKVEANINYNQPSYIEIDLSNEPTGIYLVKIYGGTIIYTLKIVVQ